MAGTAIGFRFPAKLVFDHTVQRVVAVSRAAGNLDLFVIGFDNHVWSTYWSSAHGWNGDWFPLPGQAVFDHRLQQVAAVSRAAGNLDLFVIGFDNRVWSTFWSSDHGWNGDWFPLPGQARFDHTVQHVATVSRTAGNLDLFVIGFDNRVWSTFWSSDHGWNGDWFPLPGQAVFDHKVQQVVAISRKAGSLDLFVVGFDNRIWSSFWSIEHGWNGDWFPLPGDAVFDHMLQQVAALSRTPNNLDLFIIGFDNRVWSTFFPVQSNAYEVIPMLWGNPFPRPSPDTTAPYTPYTSQEFTRAIQSIGNAGYFSRLLQYGAGQVSCALGKDFTDPWPNNANATYVATFTADDVTKFIAKNLGATPVTEGSIPIYAVLIPAGSLLDVSALGAHNVFQNAGKKTIWFWMYASNNLKDACQVATHEIVEAIGADFGYPEELCDKCNNSNPGGRVIGGFTVETYFDDRSKTCVAPGGI